MSWAGVATVGAMQLFASGGASDVSLVAPACPPNEEQSVLRTVTNLLGQRGARGALRLLERAPFRLMAGTNHFSDEFLVLYAKLPVALYEALRLTVGENSPDARLLAEALAEVEMPVRFVMVDLEREAPVPEDPRRLTRSEVERLVTGYIGGSDGYLKDFESYRSHREFYAGLDLDIRPDDYAGTTRSRFITILTAAEASVQARILDGVLQRCPEGSAPPRTAERVSEVRAWIVRLQGTTPVSVPSLAMSSATVERALDDAETLIRSSGPQSAVDRVHTALHGYLRVAGAAAGIAVAADAGVTLLFKRLREEHPLLMPRGPGAPEIDRILKSLGAVLEQLNTLRNQRSIAHPTEDLLSDAEAMLAINAARTLLHYLDRKLQPRP